MDERTTKRTSKLLSLLLRHAPEKAGLRLDAEGWVSIDDLLDGLARLKSPLDRDQLDHVVKTNDKKRFSISEDGLRIRAAQGHSVAVDVMKEAHVPPAQLFHGTAKRFLAVILAEGLKTMSRQHVHLSADRGTAERVGQRHGKPVILTIHARQMHDDGQIFYQADNGVWLTGPIAPKWIARGE